MTMNPSTLSQKLQKYIVQTETPRKKTWNKQPRKDTHKHTHNHTRKGSWLGSDLSLGFEVGLLAGDWPKNLLFFVLQNA